MSTVDELVKLAADYRVAVGSRNAAALPLGRSVRYTENGQEIPLDRGVWATATAPPDDYMTFVDEFRDQVALVGVLPEGTERFIYSTRVRVAKGRVTEIETLVVTRKGAFDGISGMAEPASEFARVEPADRRVSGKRLEELANLYFDGIERNDGSIIPAAANCTRRENGIQTVPADPKIREAIKAWGFPDNGHLTIPEQISSGVFAYINNIDNRRVIAVDVGRQVVVANVVFQHRGTIRSMPKLGVESVPEMMRLPSSFLVTELFKAVDGELAAIEAIGVFCPLGTTLGWPLDPVHDFRVGAHAQ